MRWFVLVGLLALPACEIIKSDVDAGPGCIDCDRWIDGNGDLEAHPDRPAGQQNCLAGQKATWIVVQEVPERIGKVGCVPDGTVTAGGSCVWGTPGETTGFDNCAAGLVCAQSVCVDVCAFMAAPGSLGACESGSCTAEAMLFRNGSDDPLYGVCR